MALVIFISNSLVPPLCPVRLRVPLMLSRIVSRVSSTPQNRTKLEKVISSLVLLVHIARATAVHTRGSLWRSGGS